MSAMDEEEVKTQLEHMVKFIWREADEKADEIREKAKEEFAIEKDRIVREEKERLKKDYEKKERKIQYQKRIEYSKDLNENRLKVLKARDEAIDSIKGVAQKKLQAISQNPAQYQQILRDLIIQGLLKLQESQVSVICRKEDASLAKKVVSEASATYSSRVGKSVELRVEESFFLPSGDDPIEERRCSGGVILSSHEGRIICSNTLDARLKMAFEQRLPQIRNILFGASTTRKHFD